jgi:hypothetical protein
VWGLKGRFDEDNNERPADKGSLNEYARGLYFREVEELCERLNKHLAQGESKLYMPDLKFNRSIGKHAGKCYSVTGDELTSEEYEAYAKTVLPTDEDRDEVMGILRGKDWIAPKRPTDA